MIITGVVLAALLNTANAQFAIENNSKLGAKVENVSETTKRFLLDFCSDANAGTSFRINGLPKPFKLSHFPLLKSTETDSPVSV